MSVPYRRLTVIAEAPLPTRWGVMRMLVFRYRSRTDQIAMVLGDVRGTSVHFHVECRSSEVFGSTECDCKARLDDALAKLAATGHGVVVYLREDLPRAATASALLEHLVGAAHAPLAASSL